MHDARIATFGERVEDFFLITDEYNQPLDAPARAGAARSAGALRERPLPTDRRDSMSSLEHTIDPAWETRAALTRTRIDKQLRPAIEDALALLESGKRRVAEPNGKGGWRVNLWLKKAVLLYFRINDNRVIGSDPQPYFDKVPLRFEGFDDVAFQHARRARRARRDRAPRRAHRQGRRADAELRQHRRLRRRRHDDRHLGDGRIVCANWQATYIYPAAPASAACSNRCRPRRPIVEDGCFIGARSEVVEGVVVEHGSVIGMGVFIGQSTRIYDRATGKIHYGRVPAGSVVVSGSLPAKDGSHSLYAAVIVKHVDAKTRAKTSINELLGVGLGPRAEGAGKESHRGCDHSRDRADLTSGHLQRRDKRAMKTIRTRQMQHLPEGAQVARSAQDRAHVHRLS